MNYSLRQLLLVTLLSASMLIWGITAYLNYKSTRDEVSALFDAELVQSARVLNTFVEGFFHGSSLSEHWKKDFSDMSLSQTTQKKIDRQLTSEDVGLLHSKNGLKIPIPKTGINSTSGINDVTSNPPLFHILEEYWKAESESVLVKESESVFVKYEKKLAFQLWSDDNGLLVSSPNAPKDEFVDKEKKDKNKNKHGFFSEKKIGDEIWHVYSISDKTGEYHIHVGQKEKIRSELSDEITSQLVTQFLIGLPFLGAVIWLIVGQSLKPINRLERQLAKREANYLKPLSTKKLPNEILPVVNEINNLFAQLEQAFEHERRFSADASHELRTPLAGMLTQAQVALRTTDDEVRKQALQRIKQAVNRMTYMVQQLLTFSRIESNSEFLSKESTVLSREIVQVIAELEPAAYKKRIQMEFVEDHEVPVVVNAPLINILIRNVIDNAIKYTPARGTIMITLTVKENHLQFCVEDSGPGITPDQYEQSLKRFHRCQETANTAQGSGLGFSIVQRIAAIHGAELILGASQFSGLKVTVLFPLPKPKTVKTWQQKLSFFTAGKKQNKNSVST